MHKVRKREDQFAKLSRYVTAKAIRNDFNDKRQLMIEQYRQKPDPSIKFPETVYFYIDYLKYLEANRSMHTVDAFPLAR